MASLTELVAWYGAVVASTVLAWDVFKWRRSGPRLTVQIIPYYKPSLRYSDDYIRIDISNVGEQATTLTAIYGYNLTRLQILFRRRKKRLDMLYNQSDTDSLPIKLESGDAWHYVFLKTPLIDKMIEKKRFYIGTIHSSSARPIMRRFVEREGEKWWHKLFLAISSRTSSKKWR